MNIKTTGAALLLALVAISVAPSAAANPFDTLYNSGICDNPNPPPGEQMYCSTFAGASGLYDDTEGFVQQNATYWVTCIRTFSCPFLP